MPKLPSLMKHKGATLCGGSAFVVSAILLLGAARGNGFVSLSTAMLALLASKESTGCRPWLRGGALREGRLFCLQVWGLAQYSVSRPRLNAVAHLILKGSLT